MLSLSDKADVKQGVQLITII